MIVDNSIGELRDSGYKFPDPKKVVKPLGAKLNPSNPKRINMTIKDILKERLDFEKACIDKENMHKSKKNVIKFHLHVYYHNILKDLGINIYMEE